MKTTLAVLALAAVFVRKWAGHLLVPVVGVLWSYLLCLAVVGAFYGFVVHGWMPPLRWLRWRKPERWYREARLVEALVAAGVAEAHGRRAGLVDGKGDRDWRAPSCRAATAPSSAWTRTRPRRSPVLTAPTQRAGERPSDERCPALEHRSPQRP